MIPWETLDETLTPDGQSLQLSRRGEEYVLRVEGVELMSTRCHRSEDRLAQLTCPGRSRVLIGGLGVGHTLRAALAVVPAQARVVVVELLHAVVRWNREYFGSGDCLDHPAVDLRVGDVADWLEPTYDAILLDVDNGPDGLTQASNDHLYTLAGLRRARSALAPGGVLAVWSATPDRRFEDRMRRANLVVTTHRTPGSRHIIFIGRR